ncbi:hypothetical protein EW145_g4174 [Phellinidium pouzarii]|uniref:Uncharacterized protein n=1 Tax=Phellinidium pouzarii TaxID=167371 RepID=A0A4S4L6B2_9AGAM|nr:hypothetical protein EW145_g4174 [Phellinidium pouzarii]
MSNGASYDKALLDDAPQVTPHQRQRFYDADILLSDANQQQHENGTNGAAGRPTGAAAPAQRSNTDIESGRVHSKEYTPLPPPAVHRLPWYKSRTGIIAIVIVILVIIGAVVGGAVGGTQANKNKSSITTPTHSQSTITALSTSALPTSQGAGQGGVASANGQVSTSSIPVPSSSTPENASQGS